MWHFKLMLYNTIWCTCMLQNHYTVNWRSLFHVVPVLSLWWERVSSGFFVSHHLLHLFLFIIILFYGWGNWNPEGLNNILELMHLSRGGSRAFEPRAAGESLRPWQRHPAEHRVSAPRTDRSWVSWVTGKGALQREARADGSGEVGGSLGPYWRLRRDLRLRVRPGPEVQAWRGKLWSLFFFPEAKGSH